MAYVPPALRNKQDPAADVQSVPATPDDATRERPKAALTKPLGHRLVDIHNHYAASPATDRTAGDEGIAHHSTLNGSAAEPDRLKYVVLFAGANPRWASDGIIFVKSCIHLLPGGDTFKGETGTGGGGALEKRRVTQRERVQGEQTDRGEPKVTAGEAAAAFIEEQGKEVDGMEAGQPRSEEVKSGSREKDEPAGEIGPNVESTQRVESNLKVETDPEPSSSTNDDISTTDSIPAGAETTTEAKPPTEADASHTREEKPHAEPSTPDGPRADATNPPPTQAPEQTHTPDLSTYPVGPIAVFEQMGSRKGRFRFVGHHRIARLQFLAPHSQAVLRMLEQKFSEVDRRGRVRQKRRSRASWEESMRHRWAVVKLEVDDEAYGGVPPPAIEDREVEVAAKDPEKVSVNELLKEMRLEI